MFQTPVLFIIFKRPGTAQSVFNVLRQIQPAKLYVFADGPKNEIDTEKCIATRRVIDDIDWPCEIYTSFQDKNLGVSLGPKTAIDWFFEHNEMGIILEDDILPSIDFFHLCEELLWKYKDEPKVMHIAAMNFHYNKNIVPESYYFSKVICPWGWASWKRAWENYDYELEDLDIYADKLDLPDYYIQEFYNCKKQKGTYTWDFQWLYSVLKNGGVGIVPVKNLAINIGFDSSDASHTFSTPHWVKKIKLEKLTIKNHPSKIEINRWADELTFKEILSNYIPNYFLWLVHKIKPWF